MIYITGDPHAKFGNIEAFCKEHHTTRSDVLIVLGDMAVNASTPERAKEKKEELKKIPITFFCIHGNHDRRPETIPSYQLKEYRGGKVWVEEDYPELLFARDGEVFDFDGRTAIVIGGAYSPNKEERISAGRRWFSDEQPSEEIKKEVEQKLEEMNWKVDIVLTHTTPLKYKPTDRLRYHSAGSSDETGGGSENAGAGTGEDAGGSENAGAPTVDESTEIWLDAIEEKLDYKKWYAGHFHLERSVDKLQIMFKNIEPF